MFEEAATRLDGRIRQTPILPAGPDLWFKCEFMQYTGTFKARGLLNKVLVSEPDPAVGIVTASGGNAGQAAAWAARSAGVPAEIFVPTTTPAVKLARLRALGAVVVEVGNEYAEAHEAALKRAVETGAVYCHAYDQPEVVAGAGTIGLELRELRPDTVLVACGGGGLMSGIAGALAGAARVVAAEPESAPTLHAALAHGGPIDVPVSGIAADSLGARRAGDIAYDTAVRTGVRSMLVSDADIVAARAALWHDYRIVVEHGAAAAYALLTGGAFRPGPGERVVVVLCGANTDPSDLH